MTLSLMEQRLGWKALIPYEDTRIRDGYTSDLLSDVMAHAGEDSVHITILGHKNTIAVAVLTGIRAIVLAHGAAAAADMLEAAQKEKIAVFSSPDDQFRLSAKIAGLLEEKAP